MFIITILLLTLFPAISPVWCNATRPFKCPGVNVCFNWEDVCDGVDHCPRNESHHGYDESDEFCDESWLILC